MTEQWEKQQREVDSYNVFLSAFKGNTEGDSLYDLDYRLAGMFIEIPDPRNGVVVEPDFALFNGSTLLLAEIKSGGNINSRDISQLAKSSDLSIEAAIEWLRDADLDSNGHSPHDLTNIEPMIVYYKDFIEDCVNFANCFEALKELSNHGTVLTQKKGGRLKVEEDNIEDTELQALLSTGIFLPTLVDKTVYLTENVNREVLSYSIVHDAILNAIGKDEEIAINSDDIVYKFRHRQIPVGKVNDALEFLRQINACVKKSDEYVFRSKNMSNIMSVGSRLEETTVRGYLSKETPEEGQTTLTGFSETAESDTDD